MQQGNTKGIGMWMLLIVIAVLLVIAFTQSGDTGHDESYTYADLLRDLSANAVAQITITPQNEAETIGIADVRLRYGYRFEVIIPNLGVFLPYVHDALSHYPPPIVNINAPARPGFFMQMLPMLLISVVVIIAFLLIIGRMQGGGPGGPGGPMNFGRTRARMNMQDTKRITFGEVAGLDEEKEEMAEIVDFLKAPKKYHDIGARIPRGVLLVGPPGTGKTYLARAVAGEAGVPFFSIWFRLCGNVCRRGRIPCA